MIALSTYGQDWKNLTPKLDSVSGKYGFVDSTEQFVIKPNFDQVRKFSSEYTSVRVDTLWGVIDSKSSYILKPKFKILSAVYRGHFIESGDKMKFRSISGDIKYEYLYIPGPFKQISQFKDDPEARELEDYELYVRVVEIRPCHYYQMYRPYNWIAIESNKYAKMTIDFVLDEPDKVTSWIEKDKQFEKDFEDGKIGCCSYGPYWWGE